VKSDEESFLLYQRKHEEARINDAMDQRRIINAAIAEAAILPSTPISLPVPTQLLLAMVVAGLSSLSIGFLFEYLDPSFRTPAEVQEYLDIPLLASFPKSGDQA
jgi:capsular polysaccharide biosynthesis protein